MMCCNAERCSVCNVRAGCKSSNCTLEAFWSRMTAANAARVGVTVRPLYDAFPIDSQKYQVRAHAAACNVQRAACNMQRVRRLPL
jgi:hypothetical protein